MDHITGSQIRNRHRPRESLSCAVGSVPGIPVIAVNIIDIPIGAVGENRSDHRRRTAVFKLQHKRGFRLFTPERMVLSIYRHSDATTRHRSVARQRDRARLAAGNDFVDAGGSAFNAKHSFGIINEHV